MLFYLHILWYYIIAMSVVSLMYTWISMYNRLCTFVYYIYNLISSSVMWLVNIYTWLSLYLVHLMALPQYYLSVDIYIYIYILGLQFAYLTENRCSKSVINGIIKMGIVNSWDEIVRIKALSHKIPYTFCHILSKDYNINTFLCLNIIMVIHSRLIFLMICMYDISGFDAILFVISSLIVYCSLSIFTECWRIITIWAIWFIC